MSQRNLAFPNLLNVRDLGGYPTRNGQETRWQSLLRADDLCRLTPAGEQALLDSGIRTVIDLRWPADADTHPNFLHKRPNLLQHHKLSLLGASVEAWCSIGPKGPKEMFNCLVLQHFQTEICTVLQAIAAAPAGGVLFHCVSGKDRTGLIAALLLALVDVEPAMIAQDYSLSTELLREPYLATYPDDQAATLERVRCPPEQIFNMLAYLDEHGGGVAGYCRTIGLRDEEIAQLRARLLVD